MVIFGPIKGLERSHLRHDGLRKYLRRGQLLDVRLRDALLLVGGVENLRAVLGAFIRTLAVQLRRIVRHRKIDFQKLAEGNLRRIEGDLNGLRVARGAGAYDLIMRVGLASARVARDGARKLLSAASKTACTPQKHPPARTTVSDFFSDRFSSTAGPGRLAAPKREAGDQAGHGGSSKPV